MDNIITIKSDFTDFKKSFLSQNAILNLISKNEEKFLYEKHIYDSLSIKLFFDKYKINEKIDLLDFGTGGGFPSVPIAIEYPHINVLALDSIRKKITAIENIKQDLSIKNLEAVCDRVENLKDKKFDVITSRAVASLDKLIFYAAPLLKKDGYLVAYKSKKYEEQLSNSKQAVSQTKLRYIDCLDYVLPLNELYERKLLIFKK